MYCMDSEESVKGSQAAPTRAPLTDSSESGTRFSDEGKGALVQADRLCRALRGAAWPGEFFPPFLAPFRTTRFLAVSAWREAVAGARLLLKNWIRFIPQ